MSSEVFYIEAGVLHRDVTPDRGARYIHTCDRDAFEEVARNIDLLGGRCGLEDFVGHDLVKITAFPNTQIYTALAFLKERGCVVESIRRRSKSATDDCYLDAMVEWSALERSAECQHDAGNIGYANRMIYCLDCDGLLKSDASYQDYESWTA